MIGAIMVDTDFLVDLDRYPIVDLASSAGRALVLGEPVYRCADPLVSVAQALRSL